MHVMLWQGNARGGELEFKSRWSERVSVKVSLRRWPLLKQRCLKKKWNRPCEYLDKCPMGELPWCCHKIANWFELANWLQWIRWSKGEIKQISEWQKEASLSRALQATVWKMAFILSAMRSYGGFEQRSAMIWLNVLQVSSGYCVEIRPQVVEDIEGKW